MNKAIFLDRDGVINESFSDRVKFVNQAEDFYLLDGVADAIAILRSKGYMIFVCTNQGGVASGFMKLETLNAIHDRMVTDLLAENPNAIIDGIAYCPHSSRGGCTCRKPRPGMILSLAEKHDIDLGASYMIGDMESDVAAGKAAGCQTFMVDEKVDLVDLANKIE